MRRLLSQPACAAVSLGDVRLPDASLHTPADRLNKELITAAALRANILDSQQNHQTWWEFTARAMRSGVQSYLAFLRGRRVTYFGRQGDQHTEWFPGAKPE